MLPVLRFFPQGALPINKGLGCQTVYRHRFLAGSIAASDTWSHEKNSIAKDSLKAKCL